MFSIISHVLGVILDPHVNVKNPMVRKPVHMMKPRVVTLQKSLHNSLEKRQHDLSRSGTKKSPSKSVSGSLLSYDGELFGKIAHLNLQDSGHIRDGNEKTTSYFVFIMHATNCGAFCSLFFMA